MQNKLFFFLLFITNINFSQAYTKINVGPGPEDFVLDTFNRNERLLISCDERRDKQKNKPTINGGIWEYDFNSQKAKELTRTNEPLNFDFNPLGIHLLKEGKNIYLFVINYFNKYKKNEILRYSVLKNALVFEKRFPYNSSANSIFAISKNIFYITNDKKLNGSLVLYKDNKFKKIVKHIKYPNGIYIEGSNLYLSTILSNKIYKFNINKDYTVSKKSKIAKIKGADNLKKHKEYILTSSHPKLLKVIKHFKNKEKLSPSIVYAINTETHEVKTLFKNKGDIISAASGAIIYKGYLYIAQVFDDFIIKTKVNL